MHINLCLGCRDTSVKSVYRLSGRINLARIGRRHNTACTCRITVSIKICDHRGYLILVLQDIARGILYVRNILPRVLVIITYVPIGVAVGRIMPGTPYILIFRSARPRVPWVARLLYTILAPRPRLRSRQPLLMRARPRPNPPTLP